MAKYRFAFFSGPEADGVELDSTTVDVPKAPGGQHGDGVRQAFVAWLQREQFVLSGGDRFVISEE